MNWPAAVDGAGASCADTAVQLASRNDYLLALRAYFLLAKTKGLSRLMLRSRGIAEPSPNHESPPLSAATIDLRNRL